MSDVAKVVAEATAEVKSPKTKGKKAAVVVRPKVSHPPTAVMVQAAITELKERGGSSLRAIKKYITTTYKVDGDKFGRFIKKYIKQSTVSGVLLQTKGKGASGSFKLATAAVTKKANNPKQEQVSGSKSKFEKKSPTKAKPKTKITTKPVKKVAAKSVSKSTKKIKLPAKPKAPKPKTTRTVGKK